MTIPADTLAKSLLPPNSKVSEHALEDAMRMDVDLSSVGTLWNPWTCPAAVLPFLGWGLAIAQWDPDWSEAEKRAAVADAIAFHRRKGTRAIVEEVLERFHPLLEVVEWWEANPRRDPHTFEVRAPANLISASFLTMETVNAIIRDVASVKPVRSHFDFVQILEAQAGAYLTGGGLPATYGRTAFDARHDPDPRWDNYLQTEDGEPMQSEAGELLEES